MTAMSFSMATTMPLMTDPSRASDLPKDLVEKRGEIFAGRGILQSWRTFVLLGGPTAGPAPAGWCFVALPSPMPLRLAWRGPARERAGANRRVETRGSCPFGAMPLRTGIAGVLAGPGTVREIGSGASLAARLSTMPTAALKACSISKVVVSSKRASAAAASGAVLRPESRASRRADIVEHVVERHVLAPPRELAETAAGALLGRRRDEDLHRRHPGRSPCRCRARRAPRLPAGRAKARCQSTSAARTAGIAATTEAASPISRPRSRASSRCARSSACAARTAACLVRERIVEIDQRAGDGAIEQAGVEMRQPVMQRQPLGEGALARGRRTVDGDDHRRLRRQLDGAGIRRTPPRALISGTKTGKLVSMIAGVVDAHGLLGWRAP